MIRLKVLSILGMFIYYAFSKSAIELTDEDFNSRMAGEETALVMFHATWCGYCKKMSPEFEKAAAELRWSEFPVRLAKVDCSGLGKDTCRRFSVRGYPTLRVFRRGVPTQEYEGPSEAAEIVGFVRAQAGPSARVLADGAALDDFLDTSQLAVVGYFEEDSKSFAEFADVADSLRSDFRFGLVTSDLGDRADKIVLYRPKHLHNKFEPDSVVFEGDVVLTLKSFLMKNKHGLVGHRTQKNKQEFRAPLVVAYYEVDFIKNLKGTNYWRNRIFTVAVSFSEDFNFAVSDMSEFQNELSDFGYDFTPTKKPVVFALSKDNKKFAMPNEFSVENFKMFLFDLKYGNLEPYLKSEPIPEKNDGPVKVAVARSFEEVVMKNGRDTLVMLYAPWCGHCKELAPTYEELGREMLAEDVEVVKMDGTRNEDHTGYEHRGYPSIFWAPRDAKTAPLLYKGDRSLKALIKYIAKHATNQLKRYDRSGNRIKEEF